MTVYAAIYLMCMWFAFNGTGKGARGASSYILNILYSIKLRVPAKWIRYLTQHQTTRSKRKREERNEQRIIFYQRDVNAIITIKKRRESVSFRHECSGESTQRKWRKHISLVCWNALPFGHIPCRWGFGNWAKWIQRQTIFNCREHGPLQTVATCWLLSIWHFVHCIASICESVVNEKKM